MEEIPVNTQVECTDGPCGKSTHVIINPINHEVTHVVVHDRHLPDNPTRLVPIAKVVSTSQTQINLNCSKADLAKLPPFIVEKYMQESAPGKAYQSGAAYKFPYVVNDTAYTTVKERNVPAGELALSSGMQIKATDDKVGTLDELVLDPDSGDITHLLMRSGHLWGKKQVSIPISAVDDTDGQVIYLNLDKKAVGELPTLPIKR